jgi:hypothetical protein
MIDVGQKLPNVRMPSRASSLPQFSKPPEVSGQEVHSGCRTSQEAIGVQLNLPGGATMSRAIRDPDV